MLVKLCKLWQHVAGAGISAVASARRVTCSMASSKLRLNTARSCVACDWSWLVLAACQGGGRWSQSWQQHGLQVQICCILRLDDSILREGPQDSNEGNKTSLNGGKSVKGRICAEAAGEAGEVGTHWAIGCWASPA